MSAPLERELAPGVHRVHDAYVNWYLVEEEGRVTAFDAGVPSSWESLHEALAAIGRIPGDLEAVVVTHGHPDHLGFAEPARVELGIPVWAHEDEAWLTRHPLRYKTERSPFAYFGHRQVWKSTLGMLRTRTPFTKPVAEVRTFSAGETIDVPGRPRVLPTPGHTFGHCSFHLAERETVVAGDALVTLDPYTGATGPRVPCRASTADSAVALRSLDRLADTEATLLLPGHGEPWRGRIADACGLAREAGVP